MSESVTFRLPMGQKQAGEILGSIQTQLLVQIESPCASHQIPLLVDRVALTLPHRLGRLQQMEDMKMPHPKEGLVVFRTLVDMVDSWRTQNG